MRAAAEVPVSAGDCDVGVGDCDVGVGDTAVGVGDCDVGVGDTAVGVGDCDVGVPGCRCVTAQLGLPSSALPTLITIFVLPGANAGSAGFVVSYDLPRR